MMTTRVTLGIGALGLGVLLAASPASAVKRNRPCVRSATVDRGACYTTCRDDFQVAKDACQNIDHACAETCRANREACRAAPLSALVVCRAPCESALADAVTNCRNTTSRGTPERDQCIDAVQVTAFQCRDTCREQAAPALRKCRADYTACIKACPPAN